MTDSSDLCTPIGVHLVAVLVVAVAFVVVLSVVVAKFADEDPAVLRVKSAGKLMVATKNDSSVLRTYIAVPLVAVLVAVAEFVVVLSVVVAKFADKGPAVLRVKNAAMLIFAMRHDIVEPCRVLKYDAVATSYIAELLDDLQIHRAGLMVIVMIYDMVFLILRRACLAD